VFRVLDLPPSGSPIVRGDAEVAPPPDGTTRWIDLIEPDPASLDRLRSAFGFDNLAIHDCGEFGMQSKIDDYERYLFIVIHAFTADPDDPLAIRIHEIHAFLGENYLVTVHDNPVPAEESIWSRAAGDPSILARGASWALYLAADAMVTAAVPLVDRLDEELDAIERQVIEEGTVVELASVFRAKRSAVAMRRVLRPLRDTLNTLHRRDDGKIGRRTAMYFRDLADHVMRLTEQVEEARELALATLSAYQALQATRANEVMKRLTIFSAVFLPLGFIVGFWGQNFIHLPYDSWGWMGVMLASLVLVPAGLMEWFRRNWL
jgi:magnesium transporter